MEMMILSTEQNKNNEIINIFLGVGVTMWSGDTETQREHTILQITKLICAVWRTEFKF